MQIGPQELVYLCSRVAASQQPNQRAGRGIGFSTEDNGEFRKRKWIELTERGSAGEGLPDVLQEQYLAGSKDEVPYLWVSVVAGLYGIEEGGRQSERAAVLSRGRGGPIDPW